MATTKATVEHVLDQLAPLPVRAHAMFGEYGLYCDEKFVALICDDTLFVKPTAIAAEYFAEDEMGPPYPGAKDHYVVSEERLDDSDWLQAVIARTSDALPVAKKKAGNRGRKIDVQ